MIEVYTDGACSGNPGPGAFVVIIVECEALSAIVKGYEHTTNNRMELEAVVTACHELIERGMTAQPAILYTDSQYVAKAINEGWLRRWLTQPRSPHKRPNWDLWLRLAGALQQLPNLRIQWIRGHAGNKYNQIADRLAQSFITTFMQKNNNTPPPTHQ